MTTLQKISKSQFIRGLQCPKSLWLDRHKKDVAPKTSDQQQALFDAGREIGDLAKSRFLGGTDVAYNYGDIDGAIKTTNQYIKEGRDVIFEAAAMHPVDGTYARADILRKVSGKNEWDLIEVKGSTSIKDYHIDDMSFQYHVFYSAGIRIRACYVMLIDNTYVRQGDIEPEKLFKLEDVSAQIFSKQAETENVAGQLGYILARQDDPDVAIGSRCFTPFECNYREYCWKHVPAYSIYSAFTKAKADEIAKRHCSFDLKNIPASLLPSGNKGIDVSCFLSGEEHFEPAPIKNFLNNLQYPLQFLDYETLMPAIPLFDGTRPFQQIPFQFSLHIQEKPDGDLIHRQFLHKECSDPRPDFIKNLINSCEQEGTILVYNQSFEMTRNKELARDFPEFHTQLDSINQRMADLLIPFRSRWIYSPKQNGSVSIKAVLPAFTDLSYEDMEIGNGGEASSQYEAFIRGQLGEAEYRALWINLEKYCAQDTYAMTVLLNVLKNVSR